MNRKFILKSISVVGALFFFAGCSLGNPPQPCNVKIQDNHKNITDTEKTELIKKILKNNSNGYAIDGNCIKVDSFWGVGSDFYHDKMKNCFVISNNVLKRKDYSVCFNNGRRHECDYIGKKVENYADYINKLQNKIIPQQLPIEISKYAKYKEKYYQEKQKAEKRMKNIKTVIVDENHVLSQNVLNKIKYNTYIERPYGIVTSYTPGRKEVTDMNPIKLYVNNKPIDFKIVSNISNTIHNSLKQGRYLLVFENSKLTYSYKNVPIKIIFKIKGVYFNFIPSNFVAGDKNIDVIINYDYKNNLMKIKFVNKTTKFVEINALAMYYNDKVYDNLLKKPIKLPPKSFKTITKDYFNLPVLKNRYIKVTNKNERVKFGISVGYKIINENILKNIYKVNKYSIKDF